MRMQQTLCRDRRWGGDFVATLRMHIAAAEGK